MTHHHREGNHPDDSSRLTYKKLLQEVCRFANVLKAHGVRKGDRVSIYMPMTMELPIAMLACNRIGAVHSIVVRCRPVATFVGDIILISNCPTVCRLFVRLVGRAHARLPGQGAGHR